MGMYVEIEILMSISPWSFTITWLKPYQVISCLCLCRDSPGKEDIHSVQWPVVVEKDHWLGLMVLVS